MENEWYQTRIATLKKEIERLKRYEAPLTAERENSERLAGRIRVQENRNTKLILKVEKLRNAVEEYVNNDLGRKDTVALMMKALADTEDK